jgi:hypothetical protein
MPRAAHAARLHGSASCYRSPDVVACLIGIAKKKLAGIHDANERADAVGDLLYTIATTHSDDDVKLADQARMLAGDRAVKPVKQMDLLYAIDLRENSVAPPARDSYAAALRRFAALQNRLSGNELVELYLNACSITNWDGPFRERWLDFAESVCTSEHLKAVKADDLASQALLLAMMPIAMTLAEDRDGFASSADAALTWLRAAQKSEEKAKDQAGKDFVASVGVLMHTTHSACLDAFDEPDAADAEVSRALKSLRAIETRHGISGKTTPLRRQVVEALFDAGRDAEAAKLLDRMLSRVDADPDGKRIPLAEQISILLLAARLEYYVAAEQDSDDASAGRIRM